MKEGWRIVTLGEVCDRFGEYGMSVSSKPYDGIRYIRITDITDDGNLNDDYVSADINYIDDDYRLQKGDVLFARTGATVGKTLVYKEEFGECVYAGYLIRYRPNLSLVLPQFLFYCTHYQEYYNWVKNNQKAAAQPNISAKLYNGYEFPLPPLEEQHRIVSILDASFEKIDALKKNAEENLKNAKALFQQVLAQELKPKEGWVEKKLGEIGVGKLTYGSATPAQDYDGAVRYVRITDIDDNGNLSNERKSPSTIDAKYFLNEGDLLFARTGATVGKTYLYKKSDGRCLYAGYLIRLKVNKDVVNPLFVFHCTKTSTYWDFIKKSQRTAAQPNINAEQYSNYTISFPPSIEEQHRIVRTLDTLSEKCRRLEQVAQQTIRECDALKQSILRQAFSGEL